MTSEAINIDRYIVYNYDENVWSIGQLSRNAWLDEGVFDKPIATYETSSNTNCIFNHEVGNDDDGSAMQNVFIESSDFDLNEGEEFQHISRLIPDVKFTGTDATGSSGQKIDFVLKRRNFPGEDLTTVSTSSCFSNTTKIDTRLRGRQAVLRVQSNDDDTTDTGMSFRLGATRLDVKPDGKR